jgi:hypothetical protein
VSPAMEFKVLPEAHVSPAMEFKVLPEAHVSRAVDLRVRSGTLVSLRLNRIAPLNVRHSAPAKLEPMNSTYSARSAKERAYKC